MAVRMISGNNYLYTISHHLVSWPWGSGLRGHTG